MEMEQRQRSTSTSEWNTCVDEEAMIKRRRAWHRGQKSNKDKSMTSCLCKPTNCQFPARSSFLFLFGIFIGCLTWRAIQQNMDGDFRNCQIIRRKSPEMTQMWSHLMSGSKAKFSQGQAIYGDDDDHFLFVGIMTARKYLDNRAMSSNKTWAHKVPGQVVYFLGEGEPYYGDMNVVMLKGVTENDYPPQKKSFAMVEYMSKHYAPYYKWLIRADDDVYIKTDELVRFLKSVNSSGLKYIGQPGFGKQIEAGKLGLSGAFCMGGPGVIMSSQLVTAVEPALKDCLKLTVTGHEDTELGRCITLTTGVTCTSSFEMKELMYQNYGELSLPNSSFKKTLGKDELRALTLHPLKDPDYVFRMENFFNVHKLKELKQKQSALTMTRDVLRNILETEAPRYTEGIQRILRPPGIEELVVDDTNERAHYVNLDNIKLLPKGHPGPIPTQAWEFVRYKRIFSSTLEIGKVELSYNFRRRDALHANMWADLQRWADTSPKAGGKKNTLQFVNETYQRLSPDRAVEGMLYLKVWGDNKKKMVQPVYYRHHFTERPDFREADKADEFPAGNVKKIYMLMPLFQRSAIYKRFLVMFAKTVEEYKGHVELRVALFTDDRGEYRLISAATSALLERRPHIDIRLLYKDEPFNRGRGLMALIDDIPYSSLLLFMDVDMEFNALFLERVSLNTVEGRNSFFPVYFVHYNPESICYKRADCDVYLNSRRDEVGMWRSFSYGIGAVYKSDLVKAGGFKTDIVGWGLEDVDFFEKCQSIGLPVMRPADPSLIHRYHPRECNTSLPANQLQQCYDSGNAMLGSVESLYHMLDEVSKGEGI